jgi:hypothetical protein
MQCQRMLVAAVIAACGFASSAHAVPLIYEQTFSNPAPPQSTITAGSGWTVDAPYNGGFGGASFNGTYSGNFAPGNALYDNVTNPNFTFPINGNTGVFIGRGGALNAVPGIFYTTDGVAGFTEFDPATCQNCTFSVYANTQAGGADDHGYFAIQAGTTGRFGVTNWYISSTPMAAPTVNGGNFMDLRTLLFNPAVGNWNNLTVDPTGAADPVIGSPAGSLAGLHITGVGIVQQLTNPAPDANFTNDAFSSWNYADYRITCGSPVVPEPSTILMLALAAPVALRFRRRKS